MAQTHVDTDSTTKTENTTDDTIKNAPGSKNSDTDTDLDLITEKTDNQNIGTDSKTEIKTPLSSSADSSKTSIDSQFVEETDDLMNLHRYNIYTRLPKIGQPLVILPSPFSKLTYGPYAGDPNMYKAPYPPVEELVQRIIALKKTIEIKELANLEEQKNNKVKDKDEKQKTTASQAEMTQFYVHLGDLYSMKYARTHNQKNILEAVSAYKNGYSSLPDNFVDQVSINMTNALIIAEDFATAFPIIKKLSKENDSRFAPQINDTLLEFYFMAGRYNKADDVIQLMTKHKELINSSHIYMVRAGDIFFFLNRFEDSTEWYQQVLKPDEQATAADNLSWLYLAESLHNTGNEVVSQKIYSAMQHFFEDTEYEHVIQFRLANTLSEKEALVNSSSDTNVALWMRTELLTLQFKENPKLFTAESFESLLSNLKLDEALADQAILLQGYAYRNEKKYYQAVENFHKLEIKSRNMFIREALNKLIINTLIEMGYATANDTEAHEFMRYLVTLRFNLKNLDADKVYNLLYHNLSLIGIENASAELTLRIIEQSIHMKKEQTYIQFRLAENMHDAFAYRQSIKTLNQIDPKLLDPDVVVKFHKLLIENFLATNQKIEALDSIDAWEKEGSSAEDSYWITLKKTGILYDLKKFDEASELVINTIGNGNTSELPEKYKDYIVPLMAYQVILYNKIGRNNECLVSFYDYQDKIMQTDIKDEIIFSVLASTLAMNKTKDVEKLLRIAKINLNETTYSWIEKWAKGGMWINQINKYLDKSSMAINGGMKK